MKILEDYKPQQGTLCISSALRDITRFLLKTDYDEDFYYGLGSGLFFGYTEAEDMVGLGAFTDLMLDNLKDNLTLSRFDIKAPDNEVFDLLISCINSGLPAIVKGMHFHTNESLGEDILLKEELNLPMNLHYTVVYGYDEENHQLLMADNYKSGWVSYERFLKIRDEQNIVTLLLFPKEFTNISHRIYAAIRKTVDYWYSMPENPKSIADYYTTNCLHLSKVHNTISGIEKFHTDFLRGQEVESLDNFSKTMFFLRTISYRGTGGDMTRGMQSRFLKQCYKITEDDRMLEASKIYSDCARKWRKLLKALDCDPEQLYAKVTSSDENQNYFDMISDIYESEMAAVEVLKKIAYE